MRSAPLSPRVHSLPLVEGEGRRINSTHLLFCEITRGPEDWYSKKSGDAQVRVRAEGLINDNAPMMIVLSFSSLWVVSIDGIVPDMARGLVVIVLLEERTIKNCGGEASGDGGG